MKPKKLHTVQLGVVLACLFSILLLWISYLSFDRFAANPMVFGRILYCATIFVLALGILRAGLRFRGGAIRLPSRYILVGTLSAAFTCAFVIYKVPTEFRIMQDEGMLTSVSFMMEKESTALAAHQAIWTNGQLVPLQVGVEKRPPLFSFLVHLMHYLRGYSPANSHLVNFLGLFLLLLLFFFVFLKKFGLPVALAAQWLIAAQPAVFLSATSAGFDLISSLLFFTSLYFVAEAWHSRDSSKLTDVFVVLTIFSFSRYESIFLSSLLIIPLLWHFRTQAATWLRRDSAWLSSLALVVTPIIWLLFLVSEKEYFEVNLESVFSFRHLFAHTAEIPTALFSPPDHFPRLHGFYFMSLSGTIVCLVFGLRGRLGTPPRLAAVLFMAVAASTFLALSHFYGTLLNPDAWRYFLNFLILVALAPLVAVWLLVPAWMRSYMSWGMAALAALFLPYTISARSPEEIFSDVGATRNYKLKREFLAGLDPKNSLLVSRFPASLVIQGFSSIDFETLESNIEKIQRSKSSGEFRDIYVFQIVSKATGEIAPTELVPASVKLEVIQEKDISSRSRLRISKLK